MAMELVTVRFWSLPQARDCDVFSVEFEFPTQVVEKLENGKYASFTLTLNKADTYVFHKIDVSGEMPVIDVVPRLN